MNAFGHTTAGPRENLEDVAAAIRLHVLGAHSKTVTFAAVLDGVGGEDGGEVAALLALVYLLTTLAGDLATRILQPNLDTEQPDFSALLSEMLIGANGQVVVEADRQQALSRMAATAVCVLMGSDSLDVAWVGDSRCYVYSHGRLTRLTRDHSLIQELLDTGELLKESALDHPAAHVVTRYLGQREGFEPQTATCVLKEGDLVVLCSDGLTDAMSDEDLGDFLKTFLRSGLALADLPLQLVEAAIRGGTHDNVTVLCCVHEGATARSRSRTRTDGYIAAVADVI